MNLIVTCPTCGTVVRVFQRLDSSEDVSTLVGPGSAYWPDGYTCVRCGERATGCDEAQAPAAITRFAPITELSANEFFAAQEGLGLPTEADAANLSTVTALLKEKRVVRVVGADAPGGVKRCILDYLELEDGTRIYIGAGYEGAVVYRVSAPATYAQNALQKEGSL